MCHPTVGPNVVYITSSALNQFFVWLQRRYTLCHECFGIPMSNQSYLRVELMSVLLFLKAAFIFSPKVKKTKNYKNNNKKTLYLSSHLSG